MKDNNCTLARELLAKAPVITTDAREICTVNYPAPDIRGFQGGCSDGERYYYNICMHYDLPTQEHNYSRIAKIDLQTCEVVKWSDPLSLDHANDATYNPHTNEIIICHNKPRHKHLTALDADTLTPTRGIDLPVPIYAIEYNEKRNVYAVGLSGTWDYRLLDADFHLADDHVHHGTTLTARYTKQGMCADDELIYFILWDGKHKDADDFQNEISVYDWDGNFRGLIEFDVGVKEPENLSIVNGEIVAVCGKCEPILYRLTPKTKD